MGFKDIHQSSKPRPTNRKLISPPTALGGALFSFLFSLFSLLPTLFPLGRGPFASLARVLIRHPRVCGDPCFCFPCVYLPFIDAGVFEDRAIAMGKPHCNRSICTFRLWNMPFHNPVPELVEGWPSPHALSSPSRMRGSMLNILSSSPTPLRCVGLLKTRRNQRKDPHRTQPMGFNKAP